MPSNQTPNYQLNQWERSDKVQMEDFNADNAKIDAALGTLATRVSQKAEQSALQAEVNARAAAITSLSQSRNCRAYHYSYTGTGQSGREHPSTHTFPGKPLFVYIAGTTGYNILAIQGQAFTPNSNRTVIFTWSGNSLTWYEAHSTAGMSPEYQCNSSGKTYQMFAILEV